MTYDYETLGSMPPAIRRTLKRYGFTRDSEYAAMCGDGITPFVSIQGGRRVRIYFMLGFNCAICRAERCSIRPWTDRIFLSEFCSELPLFLKKVKEK